MIAIIVVYSLFPPPKAKPLKLALLQGMPRLPGHLLAHLKDVAATQEEANNNMFVVSSSFSVVCLNRTQQ